MDVYLDDRPLKPQTTLAAALRSGVDEAARSGRVIVEVMLDGEAMADSLLDDPPEEPVGTEVRLTSVEPRALVRVTLLDAAEALEKAAKDQGKSAELIQIGKIEEGMAPLSAALETWQVVREAVEKAAGLVHLPLEEMEFPGGARGPDRLLELIAGLTRKLEEVKRTLGVQDWSGLADVLAYDLTEEAQRWTAMLRALAEGLKGR
jgi:hypothetical protein